MIKNIENNCLSLFDLLQNFASQSSNSSVIVDIPNYDYGLPGRGLSLWHINESNLSSLNDDIDNRTVKIINSSGKKYDKL